jgi:hypothetical protein
MGKKVAGRQLQPRRLPAAAKRDFFGASHHFPLRIRRTRSQKGRRKSSAFLLS